MLSILSYKLSLLFLLSVCLQSPKAFSQTEPLEISDGVAPVSEDIFDSPPAVPAAAPVSNHKVTVVSASPANTDEETINRINKEIIIYENDLAGANQNIQLRVLALQQAPMLEQKYKDLITAKKYHEVCTALEAEKAVLAADSVTNKTKIEAIELQCKTLAEIISLENFIVMAQNQIADKKLAKAEIENKKIMIEKEKELAKIQAENESRLAELAEVKKQHAKEKAADRKSHDEDRDIYNELTCKAFEQSDLYTNQVNQLIQTMVMPMLGASLQQNNSSMELARKIADYSYSAYQASVYGTPLAGSRQGFNSGFGDPTLDFWGNMAFNSMMSNNIFSGNNPMLPQMPFMGNPQQMQMPGEVNFFGPGMIYPQQMSPNQFYQRGQQMIVNQNGTVS